MSDPYAYVAFWAPSVREGLRASVRGSRTEAGPAIEPDQQAN